MKNAAEVGGGVVWFGVGVEVGLHFFQFNLIISFITVHNYNYSNTSTITSTAIVFSIQSILIFLFYDISQYHDFVSANWTFF